MTTRTTKALILAATLGAGGAAQSAIACKIEDWTYQSKANALYITGATTCREGRLTIRAYDGNTDEFLGSGVTFIRGYAFQTYLDARVPGHVSIKYHIE